MKITQTIEFRAPLLILVALILIVNSGCQSLNYWWNNCRRVGPNYKGASAPTADVFSQSDSPYINPSSVCDPRWWRVFNDPDLDLLIDRLHKQNLSLKAAVCRIAEARALRNIAAANLFPQSQTVESGFVHNQSSQNADGFNPLIPITTDNWSASFDAGWEIDLWGRLKREIASANANICANVKDYDFLLITLIGDVASLYINIRSLDERLELARLNVKSLQGSLEIAKRRFEAGRTSKLDVVQAESNLAATQSLIPQLELAQRQSLNALSVLMAIPPSEIEYLCEGGGKIPEIPASVIVGIPCELIRRRPDIRAAERQLAAQFEQVGIAEADFYPTFTISGTVGYQAAKLSDLIQSGSYTGTIAPGFSWKILNYGRLQNNVRVQQTRVNQLCYDFQNTVLQAQREVEDGIVDFIKNSERYVFDKANEKANRESLNLSLALYKEGEEDFNRVFVVQSNLVQAQDQLVATRANIAQGLISTYKALGGGWEIRCEGGVGEFEFTEAVEVVDLEAAPDDLPSKPTFESDNQLLDASDIE